MRNIRKNLVPAGLAMTALLLVWGLMLGGCESESVAPHDGNPELSAADAANQSSIVAMAMVEVLPQLVDFVPNSPNKVIYTYTFPLDGDIAGSVDLDFRIGGAEGASATYSEADYCHLYTEAGDSVVVTVEIIEGAESHILFTFDIMGTINQAEDSAVILEGSHGSMTSGIYTGTFAIAGVGVAVGHDYPDSGTVTFTGASHETVVTFDGTGTAVAVVDETDTYEIDLDTGEITAVDG